MKVDLSPYRVRPKERVDLRRRPTRVEPLCPSKDAYEDARREHVERLDALERVHYATNRHALLVVLQGMDAAGKDGAIKHVMAGIDPRGCDVRCFQHPTPSEARHDFLWRTTLPLPERGRIAVFNRSYYEEVLIVRVHPEILRAQNVPEEERGRKGPWEARYRSILDFEGHLHRSGTRIVKIFLHLSKQEQRERFLARIDDPSKRWKITQADLDERGYWKAYRRAYEACLSATSTAHAPWFVVPADRKKDARLIVSQAILDAMEATRPAYPKLTRARREELERFRAALSREGRPSVRR